MTNNSEQLLTALIIVSEIALGLMSILIFVAFIYFTKLKRKKGEVDIFQKQVKNTTKDRQDKLLEILLSKHGSEQSGAQEFLNKIENDESKLYNHIMTAYLGKKKDPLGLIGKQVESLVMTCCDDLPVADNSDDLAIIDQLKEQSKSLEEENRILKEKLKQFTPYEDKSAEAELYWEQADGKEKKES